MSRIDSFLKRSPLKIVVSRKTKLFYADSHGSHVDSHDSLARWLAYHTHSDSAAGHISHDSLNISSLSGKCAVVFRFSQSTGSSTISHSLHSLQAPILSL